MSVLHLETAETVLLIGKCFPEEANFALLFSSSFHLYLACLH